MSTALDIIKGSLKKIGVLAAGESLASEDANDALRSLNLMIGSWSTQGLLMIGKEIETFSLISGQNSYTLGNGGDFDTTVPVKIDCAFVKYNNNEYPVKIIDNKKWGEFSDKTLSSNIPTHIYIDNNYPLKKIYVYPKPSSSTSLVLHTVRQISSFASLAASVSLPSGYEEALEYNFAIRLAPEYGKSIPAEIMSVANETLSNIKRVNIKPREVSVNPFLVSNGYSDVRII